MTEKQYNIRTMDVYRKGDLKGYAQGFITFDYDGKGNVWDHEFLYRFDDAENGDNWTIVSIDYGYKIPYIEEVWQDIEQELKDRVEQELLVRV